MKIIKGNYGECRFCDNMDSIYGMPSLKDGSIDLCFGDPPYGTNYDKRRKSKSKIHYDDSINLDKKIKWYNESKRISNTTMFMVSRKWFNWWYENTKPNGFIQFIYPYSPSASPNNLARVSLTLEILVWGKTKQLNCNLIKTNVISNPDHPAAKSDQGYREILSQWKPKSVLDPFMGIGPIASVCEELGINWIGFELNEKYISNIRDSIKSGIKNRKNKRKQNKLF